jgi:hypothetical protein
VSEVPHFSSLEGIDVRVAARLTFSIIAHTDFACHGLTKALQLGCVRMRFGILDLLAFLLFVFVQSHAQQC